MTKKTVKLMMAALFATGMGMSAFIEPAEAARRTGNDYSQTGEDEQFVQAQFSLVNATREGIPIDDDDISLGIGLFIGAIENYSPAKGEICLAFSNDVQPDCNLSPSSSPFNQSSRYLYNSSGFPIFRPTDPLRTIGSSFDGNLLAQFIESGQELYGQVGTPTAAIAYRILRGDEPVFSYRLLDLDRFDITQAVNSLEYILDNNLLGLAKPVIGRFTDSGNLIVGLGIGDALVQSQFHTVVPEPNTAITSLLGFAVLGTGSLLKRKIKQH